MSKPVQGVFIGMFLMSALGLIALSPLSPRCDFLVTAIVLIPSVFAIRYWNNRKPSGGG